MKNVLIPVLLAVFSFLWVQTPEGAEAGRIPVLSETAKHRPQSGRTGSDGTVTVTPRVEVNKRSAPPLKSSSGGDEVRSGWLPDVSRRISSKSVMIIDAETGEELYTKSPDNPRQPASTIKVLTGMIALKSLDGSDMVQVSRKAAGMPRSKIYLDPKKSYRANDLINAVLLASANDASVALAEKIAGSEKSFAEMMTLRAKLWGAKNTICRTASGLTAEGQHSTARDLALIFRQAMQDEDFAERMGKTKVRTSYGTVLHSHNKALWRVNGAEGGKTGYTLAARQTYVGQFSHEEGTIIVALMGSETMWADVKNLVEYGFKKQKLLAAQKRKERADRQLAMAD